MTTASTTEVELVPLPRKEDFPAHSFGARVYPEIMDSRMRPASALEVPITTKSAQVRERLAQLGISKYGQLLENDTYEFAVSLGAEQVKSIFNTARKISDELVETFGTTPYGRLVGAVDGFDQGPVPLDDEATIAETSEGIIASLDDRDQKIIRQRYGFDWSQPLSYVSIGRNLSLSNERTRQLAMRSQSMLRNAEGGVLRHYSAFPVGAVGRLLGYVYRNEVPEVTVDERIYTVSEELDKLNLTPREELRYQFWPLLSCINRGSSLRRFSEIGYTDLPDYVQESLPMTFKTYLERFSP